MSVSKKKKMKYINSRKKKVGQFENINDKLI